jgi:hypothetical protein
MKFRDIIQSILEGEYMFHFTGGNKTYGKIDVDNVEPYYSDSIIYMSGRDTGHFGSGMYFSTYSCKDYGAYYDDVQQYKDDYKPEVKKLIKITEGLYRVNTDLYQNLYRIKNEEQGRLLHKALNWINASTSPYNDKPLDKRMSYPKYKHNLELLGLKMPPYREFVAMVAKGMEDIKKSRGNEDNKEFDRRSMSTRIMEYNGYNGVNTSGVPALDNTTYGSVIYDMQKINTDFVPVGKNQIHQYCEMKNGIINNDRSIFDNQTPEKMVMYLLGKDERVLAYQIKQIPEKYISFFFNRYYYFLYDYDLEELSDYTKKMYFISLTKKLKTGTMVIRNLKREMIPLFEHDLNIILNPNNIVQPDYDAKPITLLQIVLSRAYDFDDKKYMIPLIKKIKETGRELNPQEQDFYDDIKLWNEEFSDWEGVF